MFHCRPSELSEEDGLLLLRLMELKSWRDKAQRYDDDPATKLISSEDKMRFMFLAFGDDTALHRDKKSMTMDELRELQIGGIKMSDTKKEEIKAEAQRATTEFREEQKRLEK